MTPKRWFLSAFICWHLIAVAIGALPPFSRVPAPEVRTLNGANHSSWLGGVTHLLDWTNATLVRPFHRAATLATGPLRPPVAWYLGLAGLAQPWGMFSNPPHVDQYLRTRYYIRRADGRLWAATELVLPANREDRARLLRSFRDSYRDKAIAIALEEFYRHRKPSLIQPGTRPDELPADLAPIGRYFARRFARRALPGTDRIVRTEVWAGQAPTAPPGALPGRPALTERLAALQSYYEGPVEHRLKVPPYPPYHGAQREADIEWVLEYFEEP